MLLLELINPIVKHVQLKTTFSNAPPNNDIDNSIGRGSFHVVNTTNDPHIVSKNSTSYWVDGADIYAIELVKSKNFNNNPYFPRIYNLTNITDAHGETKINIDMERLQEFQVFDADIISSYIENIIDIPKLVRYEGDDLVYKKNILLNIVSNNINRYIAYGNHINFVKDPLLVRALEFIRDIAVKYDLIDDFHPHNIMARIGGTGIQMVITDPLTGERKIDTS